MACRGEKAVTVLQSCDRVGELALSIGSGLQPCETHRRIPSTYMSIRTVHPFRSGHLYSRMISLWDFKPAKYPAFGI
jgi:hypothetical protein